VNWDPVDNTVLAAEQIDSEGRSWRSGAVVEKRKLRQWMVETTRYAKRLSDGLQKLSNWDQVADIQSNWIGKCDVYRFLFPLRNDSHQPMEELLDLRVDDPIGVARASFIVIRQGHPLSDPEHRLPFSVLNGISGVWMPVIVVPENYDGPPMHLNARCGDTVADALLVEQFNIVQGRRALMPMNLRDVQEIAKWRKLPKFRCGDIVADALLVEQFKIVQDRRALMPMNLRDVQEIAKNCIRQRSWGTPIPMILSPDGVTAVPLSDNELPLLQGRKVGEKVPCDRYYLRYLDPHNQNALLSREASARMPVDIYVGGIEHAAVHMFFARFVSYFLTDIGVTQ
ncbi:hypothetical protein TELCIR_18840, partial [Teladorsagia circumcincta]